MSGSVNDYEKCSLSGDLDKDKLSEEEMKRYYEKGAEFIKAGKYAVVTMAGGQGTRLGHNGPKGTLIIDKINPPKS